MTNHPKIQKVSLIIPAHNEAENISAVLSVAKKAKDVNEIIVIADACIDHTASIAKTFKVRVIERPKTQGKGSAMIAGVSAASGDIIMFADADLENLTTKHITQVLKPIISGKYTMSVGLRDRVFGLGALIPKIYPMYAIGGERAMTKDFFNSLPKDKNSLDFGIETVMNYYAKKHNLKVSYPILKNLHQVIKEKKYGFTQGFSDRLKLMRQVKRARKNMKNKTYL
ncbi:glycosyltransferase family 2 protein [Candidatus Falkowbacteria bacterium]|uniref:Glycosyl transferase family 2 n=1 Tax=Candidatus Buchananbacteria bacterium CG10_big_fil_rev_8_21_14_0_10_33_19 TaxID=1974525 RepID=A0A2H0W5N8_9BACT|nr:glycosyltransferase family 2 protein [Candidatus Falkowbacteria bacterium]PIS05921.1 MAG: glycosyl transferase family 2 [Candidatus Buchananbacteria bacterium CG10_big_fil_rev_8_21_14_0_10_33_19]